MSPFLKTGILYGALTLLIMGPLFNSFYTDDDFDHVEAAVDGSEFRGREGWYNYIPVAGAIWWVSLQAGYQESAIILRMATGALFVISAMLLFVLTRRVSGEWEWACLAGAVFIMHPALFEPLIRLSCMHYALGLMFQLCAMVFLEDYVRKGRERHLALFAAAGVAAVLSSLHSISLMPLSVAFCITMLLGGQQIKGKRLWHLAAALAAITAVALLVMVRIGVFSQSPKSSSLGQWIVEHAWMLFYLGIWHVPWGANWYIELCGIRIAGIPMVPLVLTMSLPCLYGMILIWQRKKGRASSFFLAFSMAAIFIAVFFPPKPHAMSRYMYYAGPWVAVVFSWAWIRAWHVRNRAFRFGALMFMVAMLGSSAFWYSHQIRQQRAMSMATSSLVRESLAAPLPEVVCVDNMPRIAGDQLPFPRASFYWVGQALMAITPPVADQSQVTHLAFRYADNRNWEVVPDRTIDWTSDRIRFLNWDPEGGGTMQSAITDGHRELMGGDGQRVGTE